jgi:hypothetical protein
MNYTPPIERTRAGIAHATFTLTPIEIACGVTLADVRDARARGYVLDSGAAFVAPLNIGPALATAAARLALGVPVTFDHLALGGYPVYVPASRAPYAQTHDTFREPTFA